MSGSGPVDRDGATTTLHVRPSRPGALPPSAVEDAGDLTGGARPVLWLGARSTFGLALPDAKPAADQLYAPRGVWLDDQRLIVADTGNHRVLIWHQPTSVAAHGPADVVLGQPDFQSEGAQASGRGPGRGMRLPTGVLVHDERLIVADAWNHRLLIWDRVPTASDTPPDRIVGQADPTQVEENRGGACGPHTFYWPFGIAIVDGTFYVTDTGNRRVLAWRGVPDPDTPPAFVLGQPTASDRDENRGQLGPDSFRWPHDVAGNADILFVADAGNHRLLGWKPSPGSDRAADTVLGQDDFVSAAEFPYAPQSAARLRFPYAAAVEDTTLAVADTANNRLLIWDTVPQEDSAPADRVLGQPSFAVNGENRWDAVADDTFCWPYGISLHGGRLAVADSGNNRVTIWELDA